MTDETCILCKHSKTVHAITLPGVEFCVECLQDAYTRRVPNLQADFLRHKFKLDNLQLVEDLAKEKGLV